MWVSFRVVKICVYGWMSHCKRDQRNERESIEENGFCVFFLRVWVRLAVEPTPLGLRLWHVCNSWWATKSSGENEPGYENGERLKGASASSTQNLPVLAQAFATCSAIRLDHPLHNLVTRSEYPIITTHARHHPKPISQEKLVLICSGDPIPLPKWT